MTTARRDDAAARAGATEGSPPWPRAHAYAWWAVVGALLGFGVAALLTVGAGFMLLAALLTVVGVRSPALRNRSAVAVLTGMAAAPLYIAWLNRKGPGDVCQVTATSSSCTQEWSPWPFVAVALVMVAASVVLARRADPHTPRTGMPGVPTPP